MQQQQSRAADPMDKESAAAAEEEVKQGAVEQEEEEDEDDEEECFFNSLDRVPSGINLDPDFPTSGSSSDEEFDDVRASFASAVPFALEDERENLSEEEVVGGGHANDFGLWMEESISIEERRKRLLQGMGLASRKWEPPSPSPSLSSKKSMKLNAQPQPQPQAPPPQAQLQPSPSCSSAQPDAAAALPSTSPRALLMNRSRSEKLVSATSTSDTISRVLSAPSSLLGRNGLLGHGAQGRGVTELLKNAEAGKEFTMHTTTLNKSQSGLQRSLDQNDRSVGVPPIVKELNRRNSQLAQVQLQDDAQVGPPELVQQPTEKSSKHSGTGRKRASWLKNIKVVASTFTGRILDKEKEKEKEKDKEKEKENDKKEKEKDKDKDKEDKDKDNDDDKEKEKEREKEKKEKEKEKPTAATGKASLPPKGNECLKVHQSGKSQRELTGLHMSQEIKSAHEGSIWCLRFSADARFLASAGEDHVVRVWEIQGSNAPDSERASSNQEAPSASLPPRPTPPNALANGSSPSQRKPSGPSNKMRRKSSKRALPDYIVLPDNLFSLSEQPVCSFEGHTDDVLDLSWSKSQYLLSSSMDKSVRLWDMDTKSCLKLFAHNDYVTCIQFNPVDHRYFISGSLDAKVRLWNIPDRQVVDWSDLHEMVTAVCYTPDGQGALVGSHTGCCRFYKAVDSKLHQEDQVDIQNKKRKSQAKKITGLQFSPGNPSEVLVTSADSQVRVFDGVKLTHKFRGFKNTNSQISASYTAEGKYVVCPSEDSHVYIWKRDSPRTTVVNVKNKAWVTTRSHEHFVCKDVSVAIPLPCNFYVWPGGSKNSEAKCPEQSTPDDGSSGGKSQCPPLPPKSLSDQNLAGHEEGSKSSPPKSGNGSNDPLSLKHSSSHSSYLSSQLLSWSQLIGSGSRSTSADTNAWGLVVVTASMGGDIRVYQNFGLPVRISRQPNLF